MGWMRVWEGGDYRKESFDRCLKDLGMFFVNLLLEMLL